MKYCNTTQYLFINKMLIFCNCISPLMPIKYCYGIIEPLIASLCHLKVWRKPSILYFELFLCKLDAIISGIISFRAQIIFSYRDELQSFVLIFLALQEKNDEVMYSWLKPRSHALIYTRYANYTYMYNLHPGVKIYLLRVHMFLKSFGPIRE